MPRRLEVGDDSESEELEAHLNGKDNHIEHVERVNNLLSDGRLLEGYVFEGESQTRCHDEEEDCPLEGAVFHNTTHGGTEAGAAHTEGPATNHATLTAVVTVVLVMTLVLVYTRHV